jgi:ferric enterobactin receptor
MKWMKMGKSWSVIENNKTILWVLLFSFLLHPNLSGQTFRFTFRNTPLSEALIRISAQLDVKVAFNSKKLGSEIINKDITGNSAEEVITNLLKDSGFEYTIKYNRYLIFEKDKKGEEYDGIKYQLIGSVSDRKSGEQLPFATVILNDKNLQIPASENGSFCIKDINTNPVHLFISYIGYYPLDTTILLTDSLSVIKLELNNRFQMIDSIVIKGSKIEMVDLRNDVDFATTMNLTRLMDLPNLAETDIFRMLQVLPGISYTENSQGLNIRGCSSDQNLVLFDGQTLYNLSHYYGVVSALNPNVIKDLQIYKGGYDSRFGERVSGIVDITGKSGNQYKPTVYGDINLLSANLTAEVPVGKKISVIGAVRRSYSDIYSTQFANNLFDRYIGQFRGDSLTIINQTQPTFYFYDYNAKITFRPSDLESFSLSLYGGKDYFRNSYSGSSGRMIIDATDKNTWSNYGIGASWLKQWNESLFSNLQAGSSGYDNQASNLTAIDRSHWDEADPRFLPDPVNNFNTSNQNKLKDFYLSMKNIYRISNHNELNFGFQARENNIYYHKDADKVYVYDNMKQSGWMGSAYLQDRFIIFNNLTLKPGLRLSYFNNTRAWYAEPRFSVNYRFSDAFSVRIATGRYIQFINQVQAYQETGYNKDFWVMADDDVHPTISSNHFIAGFTAEKWKFLLDAEIYYKSFTGLQEYIFISQFLKNSDFPKYFPGKGKNNEPYEAISFPSFYITGTGKTYGADLLLRYKGKNYSSWLSYSLGRSIQNFSLINSGNDIPALADQPFQISWTNMLSLGQWNFGTIMLYSAGRPYIDHASNNINQPIVRTYNRLPDYFRSDLSVNYNLSLHKIKLKPGIIFINIFNNHNYFDVNTRKFDFENTSFSEITLIQSQAFSVNMFIHFIF